MRLLTMAFLGVLAGLTYTGTGLAKVETGTEGTIWLIPHSHYDVAWLEGEQPLAHKIADVLAGHVRQAVKDADYRFVLDQIPEIEAFRKYYPSDMPTLVELVKEGRAQLVGGLYIQPDENLSEGETLMQTGVYGQRWLEKVFGRRSDSAFDIDSFGHSFQMPEILKLLGINRQAFARKGDSVEPPATEFKWMAADGVNGVLTHWMSNGYEAGQPITTMKSVTKIQEFALDLYEKLSPWAASGNVLIPVGGDYAPAATMLTAAVKDWNGRNNGIKMNVGTLADYFDAVENKFSIKDPETVISEYSGEFNTQFAGNYSARIWIKQENRRLEHALLTAEKVAVLASEYGFTYPEDEFDQAWTALVTNQFHDLLPATAVDGVYGPMQSRNRHVKGISSRITEEALKFISGKVPPKSGAKGRIVVTNQLNWERWDIFETEIDRAVLEKPFKLLDSNGNEVAYQVIEGGDAVRLAFELKIPSLGYTTLQLMDGEPTANPREVKTPIGVGKQRYGRYTASFNKHGGIELLKVTKTGRVVIDSSKTDGQNGLAGNEIVVTTDTSNAYFHDGNPSLVASTEDYEYEGFVYSGPVMKRVIHSGPFKDSTLEREVRFYNTRARMDFHTNLKWNGAKSKVTAVFPTMASGVNTQEIPYGFIERADGQHPVVKWADKGDGDWGVTLFNKGLPDYTVKDGNLSLVLLRSIDYTFFKPGDSPAALGKRTHDFEYSLYPHEGNWRGASVPQVAWEYNAPLVGLLGLSAGDESDGRIQGMAPDTASLINTTPGVVVTGLRKVGAETEVRIQEIFGKKGKTSMDYAPVGAVGRWTNALGDQSVKDGAPMKGQRFTYESLPQGIRILRLSK